MSAPVRLLVRLTPRGGRDAIEGWARDGDGRSYLKVRVAAPPADEAANAALIRQLAKAVGVPRRAVRLTAGGHARLKTLEIDGVDAALVHRIFGQPS